MASYYKRRNGTYCVRVSNGWKDGKQELISTTYRPPVGATPSAMERGVKEFAQLFEAAVHNGIYISGEKQKSSDISPLGMSVGEFVKKYYYERAGKRLSPNTLRFYKSVIDQFIVPSFGKIRLSDISSSHLQAFIDYLASEGVRADTNNTEPLSAASVKRYATVFSSIMTEACKMKFIDVNPMRNSSVDYPKIQKAKLNIYNEDEAKLFYEKAMQEPSMVRTMLLTSLLLGLRRGEVVALQWSDIDFSKNCIHITRSAYKIKGERQGLKAPKSLCSVRDVFFSDDYKEILLIWKNEQDEQRENITWKEQDFVFTNNFGDMVSIYSPTEICRDFEERAGLRHLKLHGLRHTCGSLLMANGVDAETVKNMLGHESLKTTDLYLHPYENSMKKASNILSEIVCRKGT